MSRFKADPRRRLTKWANARRRRRLDPDQRRRDHEWKDCARHVKRADRALKKAGFFDADHYLTDGSGYCACGSVADHNRRFDQIQGIDHD